MHLHKKIWRFILTVTVLLAPSIAVAANSSEAKTVVVEARGNLPGMTHAELVEYLARKTQDATGAPWHFDGAKDGAPSAPNRMVWSFKVLRKTWGIHGPDAKPSWPHSEAYVSAEVKLYLGDAYQMSVLTEETIYRRADEAALSTMVKTVSHALFVENRH